MPTRHQTLRFGIFLILLATLTGCRGVLAVHIERLPAETPATLGQVVYIAGGDVWLVDLDSDQTTRLTRDGYNRQPRISPDAQWVAYLKGDFLHITNLKNGQESQLSQRGVADYAWSPQGARLAYTTTGGLSVWDADTQSNTDIPTDLAALHRLAWHPDGVRLAVDNREGQSRQVIQVSMDGSEQTVLFNASGLMDVPRLADWSPDGRWLALWVGSRALATEEDGLPLCLLPEGGDLICLDDRVLLQGEHLAWAPDGRLAAIAGGGRETWVGKGLALLEPGAVVPQWLISPEEQAPIQPAWSPDGTRIAYSAGPATPKRSAYEQRDQALGGRHIWVIDIATGQRKALTNEGGYRDERPLWSNDGTAILFARLDAHTASLWVMNADGSGQRQVVAELTPAPDRWGDYGHIDWGNWWDWNPAPVNDIAWTPVTDRAAEASQTAETAGGVPPPPPPVEDSVYTFAEGFRVTCPSGWTYESAITPGELESVWFRPPDPAQASIGVELAHRPIEDRAVTDPSTWFPNEGGYEVHWSQPWTSGEWEGLVFVWGVRRLGVWEGPPTLMAIFYDPERELELRLTTEFTPEQLEAAESAGIEEVVGSQFSVFGELLESLSVVTNSRIPSVPAWYGLFILGFTIRCCTLES